MLVSVGVGVSVTCKIGVAVGSARVGTNVPGAMGGSVASSVDWVLPGVAGVTPPSEQAIAAKASKAIDNKLIRRRTVNGSGIWITR